MKIIILEGPDGSGKTTLAHVLMEHGYKYIHNGPPSEKNLAALYIGQIAAAYASGKPTVFDRLHLGERVYGPIMREKSLLDIDDEKAIERLTEAIDIQIVLCLPPWRVVLENWIQNSKNEYVDTMQALKKIYDAYVELWYSGRPYVTFDYTRHTVNSFARALMELHGNPLPKGVIGSQRPRFLFVVPKVTAELNKRIYLAGFEERDIAFTSSLVGDEAWNRPSARVVELPDDMQLPSVYKLAEIRRSTK